MAVSFNLGTRSVLTGLEYKFQSVITELDLKCECAFGNYLTPNEMHPIDVKPHLVMREPGLIVSTGTARSLFDLGLADPSKCLGLVVRDINPKVKAYLDFVILVMRIAENREEFAELLDSEGFVQGNIPKDSTDKYTDCVEKLYKTFHRNTTGKITELLSKRELPEEMKSYYLGHLEAFIDVYIKAHRVNWIAKKSFDGVNYYKEDEIFNQLQKYAREGKIITTVGDMGDLRFLGDQKIGIIDISNIPDYVILDFQTQSTIEKIITTIATGDHVSHNVYRSIDFHPLTEEETKELHGIIKIMESLYGSVYTPIAIELRELFLDAKYGNTPLETPPLFFSKELLTALRQYKTSFLKDIQGYGWFDFNLPNVFSLVEHFNKIPLEILQSFCKENASRLKRFTPEFSYMERYLNQDRVSVLELIKSS